MAKKLFALEEADLGGEVVELETAPEVGEVADVEAEVVPEVAEVQEQAEAIEEGMEAADQLEEVEEVVKEAAEGEGINEQAAECLRIAVEAICARVGANPKAMYSLYATENFKSPSSRKANTAIALEGVGEFLKDLWRKIKASLMNLWEKAKAFFEKHFSSLGRVKKALESMKAKVSESSGKIKDKAYIEEAPSSLVDAFAGDSDININVVKKYIAAHRKLTPTLDSFNEAIDNFNKKAEKAANSELIDSLLEIESSKQEFGTEDNPLIGGVYITYTFEADKKEGELTVEVERATIEKKEPSLGISVTDKSGVLEVIKDTLSIINDTIKIKEKREKRESTFNKYMLAIEKAVNAVGDDAEKVKKLRKLIKIAYKYNSKTATIDTELFSYNIKLAKAVLAYSAFMLKQYK